MNKEQIVNTLEGLSYRIRTDRVFVIEMIILIAMMLWGHHRGLIHFIPIKIPIAHGINQLLGALVALAIGIVILSLTNRVLGW